MIKLDRHLFSQRPYAVDLASLKVWTYTRDNGTEFYKAQVSAIWFRCKYDTIQVCIGHLWNYMDVKPISAIEFLVAYDDNRYGGRYDARWDGERYYGAQEISTMKFYLAVLKPALQGFISSQAVPAGYDGWWSVV